LAVAKTFSKIKGRRSDYTSYAGIPRVVMDHPDYIGLGGNAVKLLLELARQYKGLNNGDLSASFSQMSKRGFKSKTTLKSALDELLQANLITQTRTGVFTNPGGKCALFALVWLPIHECSGKHLEVSPSTTPHRKFSLEINKNPSPEIGQESVQKVGRIRSRGSDGKFSSIQK
jgi:hypothetical protein